MKRIGKLFVCLLMCMLFTGCFSNVFIRSSTNSLTVCEECSQPTNIDELIDNIKSMMKKIKGISGSYEITNTKNTYQITFDVITKDKRIDWELYSRTIYDDKAVMIYFKDSKFYVIYQNNGANVIMKDSIVNLVEEVQDTLDKLNATYNKDNLENLVTGDKLEGFNFEGMKENATYVENQDGTYTITYLENGLTWEYDISENYLITKTRCSAINFNSTLVFNYPDSIEITYPMGLDFLTLDIGEVKDILKIESFAELIDESLKQETKNIDNEE